MKKLFGFITLFLFAKTIFGQQQAPPNIIYGQLFTDVQLQKIFKDGKTFVDCTPKRKVKDIMYDYGLAKSKNFNLSNFVSNNFNLPTPPQAFNTFTKEPQAANHIKNLWSVLKRNADTTAQNSSLLPLPYSYIVPGGRFGEIYYWDSYFTMLGLKESGEVQMIENMVKNFAFLVDTYGHIPNGNRTYYLSRSQPPFFSMMIELLASIKGDEVYKTFLPQLQKEYDYWMDKTAATKHVVKMDAGGVLNRYYDMDDIPRQESYAEDFAITSNLKGTRKADVNRHLRTGGESGWDFSSRWFADEKNISTIQITDIIPVDLNCLLYNTELVLAKANLLSGKKDLSNQFKNKAADRKNTIIKYCWNEKTNFFFDYNIASKKQNTNITAAALFPLFVKIATTAQANAVAKTTAKYLLKPGGIVCTLNHTGQQWDAPNGWAPLQWVAISGLNNYNQTTMAKDIAKRWLALNDKVYAATGKMMEKYNVEDMNTEAGGGEYPSQDGFGWTNGVYLSLLSFLVKNNLQ